MKYSDVISNIEDVLSDNGIDLRKIESAGTVDIDDKELAVISLQVTMPSSEVPSS